MDEIAKKLVDSPARIVDTIKEELSLSCGESQTNVLNDQTPHCILPTERADNSEAIVLMAPYLTSSGLINRCGIAYVLSSLREYRKQRFWSRNFVVLFPGIGLERPSDVFASVDDWTKAYHRMRMGKGLKLRAGALQTGISIEFKQEQCEGPFGDPEIYLEGPDGLLPNLDIVNSFAVIERHRGGSVKVHPRDGFLGRVFNWLEGPYLKSIIHAIAMIVRQAIGYPAFYHGPLLKYRVNVYTLSFNPLSRDGATAYADRNLFEYLHSY